MEQSKRRTTRRTGAKQCIGIALAVAGLLPSMASAVFPASFNLSSINGANGTRMDGAMAGEMLGWSVSKAGDVNGDGIGDLIVGAPASAALPGTVFVIYGTAAGLPWPLDPNLVVTQGGGFRIDGMTANAQLGGAVAAAGDVNHDGYGDIIVGAPGESAAYVLFGGSGLGGAIPVGSLNGVNGFRIGGLPNEQLGASVAGVGDVNGDGFADVAVGAGATNFGPGCVIFGHAGAFLPDLQCRALPPEQGAMLLSPGAGADSYTVAGAGDLNGDGIGDLLVGAPGQSSVFVVYGQSPFPGIVDVNAGAGARISGPANSWFGNAVAGVGDFNGDGVDDIAVGAPLAAPTAALNDAGMAYVIFGMPGRALPPIIDATLLNGADGIQMRGFALGDRAGWVVGAAGDVNHDGIADLVVGAPWAMGSARAAGSVYVVYGRSGPMVSPLLLTSNPAYANGLNGTNGFQVAGAAAGDLAGSSVGGGVDLNGDGVDDLIIGARNASMSTGAAFVVYGQPVDSTPPTVWMTASVTPNINGWNNGPVSFAIHAIDEPLGSGVQETRDAVDPPVAPLAFDELPVTWVDPVFTTEGVHWAYAASMDRAGNKSGPVGYVARIDMTPPKVKVTGVTRGATYKLGNVPAAGCRTTDALSGVAVKATLTITGGRPNETGVFTATCAGALDRAGNAGSAQLRYSVVK